MVICCAAVNCSNRQGKGEKRAVSFHRFPLKDSKRLIQWLKAVQRDNWTPTKYSFLCSEHFTKDSFSKRLEDQHRLLKPTAVPSIFHLSEKKRGAGGHGHARRKTTGTMRGHTSAAAGKGTVAPPLPSSDTSMAKPESRKLKRASPQSDATPKATPGAVSQEQGQSLERTSGAGLAAPLASSREEAEMSATEADHQKASSSDDAGGADKSGISMDDFTPPGSGACKFIGSLHSYSFSSKHTRERPSVPREPIDRKRPKRETEPRCSGNSVAQSPPSSSLTATPQKASQSPSAPPTDVTPKPAAEAVQSEHSDANPMSINEVILSASGACKLIDSLHSYCFSARQNKSQVCCLREQVEKKNGELKSLRQRVSRSDSQVRKLQEKLEELRRASLPYLPYLSGLLPPSHEPPKMNPVVEPLSWMLGTWLSDPPGVGTFPTLQPFQYLEEVHISHVGQPMLNFSISFAKEPHVEQITRKFRLNSEGKLEQTVSMATTTQPMTQHLHVTYKKVTP